MIPQHPPGPGFAPSPASAHIAPLAYARILALIIARARGTGQYSILLFRAIIFHPLAKLHSLSLLSSLLCKIGQGKPRLILHLTLGPPSVP
jgi:hypothetical protein